MIWGDTKRERLSSYIASSESDKSDEGTSRKEIEEPPSDGGADGRLNDEVESRRSPVATWAGSAVDPGREMVRGMITEDAAKDSSEED